VRAAVGLTAVLLALSTGLAASTLKWAVHIMPPAAARRLGDVVAAKNGVLSERHDHVRRRGARD